MCSCIVFEYVIIELRIPSLRACATPWNFPTAQEQKLPGTPVMYNKAKIKTHVQLTVGADKELTKLQKAITQKKGCQATGRERSKENQTRFEFHVSEIIVLFDCDKH